MPITKAVITAAGRGTRFLPVVKSYAKELVPLLNKPNIQYLVEEAIGAGLTDICIVHRFDDTSIKDYFTPKSSLQAYLKSAGKLNYLDSLQSIWDNSKITFVVQSESLPYGNATPALAAADFIGTDNFAYIFGDDLTIEDSPGAFLKTMVATFDQYQPDAVLAVLEVPPSEINRYASIRYQADPHYPHRAAEILEKLEADQAPSLMAQGGRFIARNNILTHLQTQPPGKDNELWWTDAMNHFAKNGLVLTQTVENALWMTTGDPLRWLKANLEIALRHPDYGPDIQSYLANR